MKVRKKEATCLLGIAGNGKFHITVLFNIQEQGWMNFLVQLLSKIFSFANVISRQKNIIGIPCYTKLATHNCLLLVELVLNYFCSTNILEYGILKGGCHEF